MNEWFSSIATYILAATCADQCTSSYPTIILRLRLVCAYTISLDSHRTLDYIEH